MNPGSARMVRKLSMWMLGFVAAAGTACWLGSTSGSMAGEIAKAPGTAPASAPASRPVKVIPSEGKLIAASVKPADQELVADAYRQQIEADWLQQLMPPKAGGGRHAPRQAAVTAAQTDSTRADAAGAVDGVKDGKYGFHTGGDKNPWWQVDLGKAEAIARIIVYNRLDYPPGLHNADNLVILTSDDGKAWTKRYENKGKHFDGVRGKPLEVAFKDGELTARFIRLQVPSEEPLLFHLDEVEVYGIADTKKNIALHKPADQSSVSQWSTAKITVPPAATPAIAGPSAYPTADVIERGRKLAADLQAAGLDTRPFMADLDEAAKKLSALTADAPAEAQKAVYFQTRWVVRRLAFANPLLQFNGLAFVKRFTQETYPDVCLNHMPWVSRPGGDLAILSAKTGGGLFASLAQPTADKSPAMVRHVLNGALGPGHVHGMDLWFDGDRMVFGYAQAKSNQPPAGWNNRASNYTMRRTEEPTHIFEIGIDGSNLRQLTKSEWSDLDPTYLPSGDVAFVSERCAFSLQCNEMDKDETSCNLYVMRGDGSNIKRLSVNKDGDYLPHTLDDGTIGYTRWEYHERGFADLQSIWIVRPDGTGADALFKQHLDNPWALEDVRSIPNSKKLLAIATGHHTLAAGPVVIIDPSGGMNDSRGIGIVTLGVRPPEGGMSGFPVPQGGVQDRGGFYQTPWPLSDKYFLTSYGYGAQTDATGYALYLIDAFGNKELVYRDPAISCFIPIPLRPRQRPPVLPDLTEPGKDHAICYLTTAAFGCDGVSPQTVKYLRVSEPVGWPYDNTHGGQRYEPDSKGAGVGWTPTRIIGTVPVEEDGSAHFRVPVDRAVYFQLLDENQMEIRRMRSFISFQAGEQRSCVGCHETRATALPGGSGLAHKRPASIPTPPPWGEQPLSFLRDVQPVLDRNCVKCHSGLKPAGGLDYYGGLTPRYNRAYETLVVSKAAGLVCYSNKYDHASAITAPMALGSHRSKLLATLRNDAHRERVKLSDDDRLRLVMWIDANAPYFGSFINKRIAPQPYDLPKDTKLAADITAVHAKRCASCHKPAEVTRLDWINYRSPDKSLFLAAPLTKQGESSKCKGAYKDATDADYQAVLIAVKTAVDRAWAAPRRDLRGAQK